MKKLVCLLLVVCSFSIGYSQIFTKPSNPYGTIVNRYSIDSALYFTTDCGVPHDTASLYSVGFGQGQKLKKAAIYYDSCGHHMYVYDPSVKNWHRVDTGSGGGSGLDTIYRKPGKDSIYFTINGGAEQRIKDSTAGASTTPTLQDVLTAGNRITVSPQLIKGTGPTILQWDSLTNINWRFKGFYRFQADGGQTTFSMTQTAATLTAGDGFTVATPSVGFFVQPYSFFSKPITASDTLKLPSLIVKSDSTTIKPLGKDGSGNVFAMDHWPTGADGLTFNNGLTRSSSTIQLGQPISGSGGVLLNDREIPLASHYFNFKDADGFVKVENAKITIAHTPTESGPTFGLYFHDNGDGTDGIINYDSGLFNFSTPGDIQIHAGFEIISDVTNATYSARSDLTPDSALWTVQNLTNGKKSIIKINSDSIILKPSLGDLYIDSLNATTDTTTFKPIVWDIATGHVKKLAYYPSGASGSGQDTTYKSIRKDSIQFTIHGGPVRSIEDVNNPNNKPSQNGNFMRNFGAKLLAASNGTANCNIVGGPGDSKSYLFQILEKNFKNHLSGKYGMSGAGLLSWDFSSNYGFSSSNTNVTTWTFKDGAAGGLGVDRSSLISNGSSLDIDLVSTLPNGLSGFDSIQVYTINKSGGGSFAFGTENGWIDTISTAVDTGFTINTIVLPAIAQHFYIHVVTEGSAHVELCNINEMHKAKGVRFHKLGVSGYTSIDWLSQDSAAFHSKLAALSPDVFFIYLGTNDRRNNVPLDSFYNRMHKINTWVRAVNPLCDIMLIASEGYISFWQGSTTKTSAQYADVLRKLSVDDSVAFFDNNKLFGYDTTAMLARGQLADGLHESEAAGDQIVSALLNQIPEYNVKIPPVQTTLYTGDGDIIDVDGTGTRHVRLHNNKLSFDDIGRFEMYRNSKGFRFDGTDDPIQLWTFTNKTRLALAGDLNEVSFNGADLNTINSITGGRGIFSFSSYGAPSVYAENTDPSYANVFSGVGTNIGTNGVVFTMFGKDNSLSSGNNVSMGYYHNGSNSADNALWFGAKDNFSVGLKTKIDGNGNMGIGMAGYNTILDPRWRLSVSGKIGYTVRPMLGVADSLGVYSKSQVDSAILANAGGAAPFSDASALVKNNSDVTKLVKLSAASISTATTRTWTFPDVSGTFARIDAAQTFTGIQTFSSSPTMPIPSTGDSTTKGAPTAFVTAAIHDALARGTFVPSSTSGANVATATPALAHWSRNGNEISVEGLIYITATLGSVSTVVDLELPILSAFSTTDDATGGGGSSSVQGLSVGCTANTLTNTVTLTYVSPGTGSYAVNYHYMYTYVAP